LTNLHGSFFALTPDAILDSVEAALGARATGRTQVLNSIENRVYEIELEADVPPAALKGLAPVIAQARAPLAVVTKFYRPGRWTAEQIGEEHRFLLALAGAEVPVVPPLALKETPGSRIVAKTGTLALSKDGLFFAVFPKVRGRLRDELADVDLRNLGRFLARLHAVGSAFQAPRRLKLDVATYGEASLDFLLKSPFFDDVYRARYGQLVRELLATIRPWFQGVPTQPVHGDCHVGNVLWQETGITPEGRREYTPFFVDFDDMVIAPPVQDVWMIVRGRDEEAVRQREELLGAYDVMKEFDYPTLRLVEPLRALRLVHYAAWIARRWEDPSFPRMFPHFGSPKYWSEEIEALDEIRSLLHGGNDFALN
jgi:Ser/Thr protein kinase RdoA (MazF antagonist)